MRSSLLLIAGPCVVESEENATIIAEKIKKITESLDIDFIFKASYKKANRSRLDSFSGIGDLEALEIIKKIGDSLNIRTLTDFHTPYEVNIVAEFVDILQIPAFLCRQTDMLVAAARTGREVNIKKGQFMSPQSMRFVIDKIKYSGNNKIMLTERGTTFGYQDLVVDYRGIPEMQKFGYPVILDVTHSLQKTNQSSGISGGNPELIETIALAGVAVGVDGIFLETHPDPELAKSDGANMLKLDYLEPLLKKLSTLHNTIKTL